MTATSEWRETTIGDLASVSRGASPRPIASTRWFDASSSARWVRIADVNRSDGRTLRATTQALSPDGIARSRFLQPGTLIMSIAATVGIPVITVIPTCIHDGFVALENLKADKRFLLYLLKASEGRLREAGQSGSQMNINSDIARGIRVRIPSDRKEQARIASVLWDLDDLIASLEQVIAKKQAIKQGIMQQLLTGRTRLPGFTKAWQKSTVGQVANVKTGPFGSTLHERDYVSSGTPIITVEHLRERGIEGQGAPMVSKSDRRRLKAYGLLEGDVVFSRVGSIDRNALVSSKEAGWLFSGRLLRVRFTPAADPGFMSAQFHSKKFVNAVRTVAVGQTMPSLNTSILKGIEIDLPSCEEQKAIGSVASELNRELNHLDVRLAKVRAIKTGIMQQLLTGRTRLPVETAP